MISDMCLGKNITRAHPVSTAIDVIILIGPSVQFGEATKKVNFERRFKLNGISTLAKKATRTAQYFTH